MGADFDAIRAAGPKPMLERLAKVAPNLIAEPKVFSLALRLARVAAGTLDLAFASHNSHDWDLAAADLLVHEAGGALTTFAGQKLIYNRADPLHGALVAAGRSRHEAFLALVRARTLAFA
jgi:myo-inositol-1(or 4)-monophosphatase